MKKTIIITLIVTVLVLAGVFLLILHLRGAEEERDLYCIPYGSLSASEARAELEQDENIILLDVRTREEHEYLRIPNSMLIPVAELEERAIAELPNREARIFIYCRSGVRSITAAGTLAELGYINVYDIGGILFWEYEVE